MIKNLKPRTMIDIAVISGAALIIIAILWIVLLSFQGQNTKSRDATQLQDLTVIAEHINDNGGTNRMIVQSQEDKPTVISGDQLTPDTGSNVKTSSDVKVLDETLHESTSREPETNKNSVKTSAPNTNVNKTIATDTVVSNASSQTTDRLLPKDVMPLGIWVAPPPIIPGLSNQSYITTERYREIKDAGINLVCGLYERGNSPEVRDALEAAYINGLKYIVRDDRLFNVTDAGNLSYIKMCLNGYMKHPGYGGSLIADEPGAASFDMLGKLKKTYDQIVGTGYFYLNMLPVYASAGQLYYGAASNKTHTITYEQYVKEYIDKVNPAFFSYDYYPLHGAFPNITENYFRNMALIRNRTKDRGIPFWVFIQTCSYGRNVRTPTKEEIFWQVNTALAYGAKGIQYFTYWTPPEADEFGEGMISRAGVKTDRYAYVQEINHHIHAIDDILMNASSKGIMVNGTMPAPIDSGEVNTHFDPIESIDGIPSLIGCFENSSGKKQLYVVNISLTDKGKVTIEIKDNPACRIWRKAIVKDAASLGGLVLELEPGEGILVEII